jgi:hypothetical protein
MASGRFSADAHPGPVEAGGAQRSQDPSDLQRCGHNGHHKPRDRAADLLAPFARTGIGMAYTDDLDDLRASGS